MSEQDKGSSQDLGHHPVSALLGADWTITKQTFLGVGVLPKAASVELDGPLITCWNVGGIEATERRARMVAAAPDMLEGLKFYADQLCEGWCEGAAEWAQFEDCSGCKAKRLVALADGALGCQDGQLRDEQK